MNPDILIPEPGDLDDIEVFMDMLKEEHGLNFDDHQSQRIALLCIDVGSPHRFETAFFEPNLLPPFMSKLSKKRKRPACPTLLA